MLRSRSESSGRRHSAATGPCRYFSRAGATTGTPLFAARSPAFCVVITRSSACAENKGSDVIRESASAAGTRRLIRIVLIGISLTPAIARVSVDRRCAQNPAALSPYGRQSSGHIFVLVHRFIGIEGLEFPFTIAL